MDQIQETSRRPERDVRVTVQIIGTDEESVSFEMEREAALRDVLNRGLVETGHQLSPLPDPPLDLLRGKQHGDFGAPIADLEQPLWEYLRRPHTSNDFGIELVRAFRVNTRWAVAPTAEMTPHQILDLVGLDYQQFTLYQPNSTDVLPLETPATITRGTVFEAQRDGKYGCF